MNPFEVLGLTEPEARHATRATVRRAYAAMLRRNPPDGDAAAFRRVRDAYDALSSLDDDTLRECAESWFDALEPDAAPDDDDVAVDEAPVEPRAPAPVTSSTSSSANLDLGAPRADLREPPRPRSDPDSPPRPGGEAPPRTVSALDEFVSSTRASIRAAMYGDADLSLAIQRAARASLADPERVEATADLLRGLVFDRLPVVALALPPEFVLALVRLGDDRVALPVIDRWEASDVAALGELARAAASARPPLAAPASPAALARLACAVAIESPKTARVLSDLAYSIASPAIRRDLPLGDVDVRIRVAEEGLRDVGPSASRALTRMLRGRATALSPDRDVDALVMTVARRIDADRSNFDDTCLGRFLADHAPDLVRRARAAIPVQRAQPARPLTPAPSEPRARRARPRPVGRRPGVQMPTTALLPFFVIVAVVVVSAVVGLVSRSPTRSPRIRDYRPPKIDRDWLNDPLSRLLSAAEERELNELEDRLARPDGLTPSDARRYFELRTRAFPWEPGAFDPLDTDEEAELREFKARKERGDSLAAAEFARMNRLKMRKMLNAADAPPGRWPRGR